MQKTAKPKPATTHSRIKYLAKWVGIPLLVYFVFFCLFTWPWISHFGSHYMTDQGDGMQNVWNIWWIETAITELKQLPWHTNFLHAPFGVTLIGQTLNPFNGLMAIALLPFMDLNHAYNIMVIFAFVVGGLNAFYLCYYFSKGYIASLVGGAVFTFSSYHFAHAEGHMQLVSLQWIPLFVLLWWMFVKKPSYRLAVGVSVSLLLVLLCDYYYFLYSLMTAGGVLVYFWFRKELPDIRKSKVWRPLALLAGLCLLLVAPLPLALLRANSTTEFEGIHSALVFSTDILTPFINGGFWRFGELTQGYWKYLDANVFEATVYIGLSVLTVLIISFIRRRKFARDLLFWQILIILFGIFSLGPRLMIRGNSIGRIPMPYAIMEKIVPGMKLSGMPVRMMVMVTLGSGVIVAMVLAKLKLGEIKGRLILAAFVVVFMFEMWPSPLPLTSDQYPNYVIFLKGLPATGSVLDEAAKSDPLQLYNQTLHEKPIPFGYVSRKPKTLNDKEFPLFAYNIEGKLDRFCPEFKVRYLTAPASKPRSTTFPIIYQDDTAIVYDLKNSPNC